MDQFTRGVWENVLNNNPQHLFVTASGNRGRVINKVNPILPCSLALPNVLCVASSNLHDKKSSFSNTGSTVVHVFAPGSHIYSTVSNNTYNNMSGTSMACPQVSGLAALILTMRSNLSGQDVKKLIEKNVQKKAQYTNLVTSGGLIDVAATIRAAKSGGIL